jgi:hypothetical protein
MALAIDEYASNSSLIASQRIDSMEFGSMDTLKQAQLTIKVGCRTGETQIKPHYLVFYFFEFMELHFVHLSNFMICLYLFTIYNF